MHKNHFQLTLPEYAAGASSGRYQSDFGSLWWREIPKEYSTFREYLQRVGHKWGWDKMSDRFSAAAMAPKLAAPETRLRELMDDQRVVGYALIVSPTPKLKAHFWDRTAKVIEIENIGLFPEECGKGKGAAFLQMQFADLFPRYDVVYLSSSSTNHPHVPAFYKRMGMTLLEKEEVSDLRLEYVG